MDASVAEAAEALGISPRRVRALAEAGELPARRVGRAWVIDLDRRQPPRPPGRRLSARSAWAVLGLGHEGLSRSERQRARERQGRLADLPPAALARRAEAHHVVAHPAALRRLADDPRIVLGGVSAAAHHGADVIALDRVEGYIRAADLDDVRREYALGPPADGDSANVVLRVPAPVWPFPEGERYAPRLVVAADLRDAGDERSVRAAHGLIA
ncbi:helix-turn-helix domain-containing protein [Miltoncostaea oceani]|uniref:helix-turn-helix domain-containing protein n=1 Tax=Miltoncostaea oceani TaxID=2843216 RepID=UPI001C3C6ACB|nr:helix-turn-helix domain-containing protein [Miltoncostaea oceani]